VKVTIRDADQVTVQPIVTLEFEAKVNASIIVKANGDVDVAYLPVVDPWSRSQCEPWETSNHYGEPPF